MNSYEGLDLPQLMDKLHGLVMPEPVSLVPETPGWWILLTWLIAILMIFVLQFAASWRRNRYRREALKTLDKISEIAATPFEVAQLTSQLLKRTALAAYPRAEVASLSGKAWADFLIDTTNADQQIVDAADLLAGAAFKPDTDGRSMRIPASRWIRKHRA